MRRCLIRDLSKLHKQAMWVSKEEISSKSKAGFNAGVKSTNKVECCQDRAFKSSFLLNLLVSIFNSFHNY